MKVLKIYTLYSKNNKDKDNKACNTLCREVQLGLSNIVMYPSKYISPWYQHLGLEKAKAKYYTFKYGAICIIVGESLITLKPYF